MCEAQVLARLLQTELNEGALGLQEEGVLGDLRELGLVVHAGVELAQELGEQLLKLSIGAAASSSPGRGRAVLGLKKKGAYLVVVQTYLLKVAFRESAPALICICRSASLCQGLMGLIWAA